MFPLLVFPRVTANKGPFPPSLLSDSIFLACGISSVSNMRLSRRRMWRALWDRPSRWVHVVHMPSLYSNGPVGQHAVRNALQGPMTLFLQLPALRFPEVLGHRGVARAQAPGEVPVGLRGRAVGDALESAALQPLCTASRRTGVAERAGELGH